MKKCKIAANSRHVPDELLEQIGKSALLTASNPEFPALQPHLDHASLAALPRTCWRIHRVTMSVLYSHMNIALTEGPDDEIVDWAVSPPKLLLLHRTLAAKRWLSVYCTELCLYEGRLEP
jgi:hypothetical protein